MGGKGFCVGRRRFMSREKKVSEQKKDSGKGARRRVLSRLEKVYDL